MLLIEKEFYKHVSIAVETPAATMFVFIIEDDNGKPAKIMIEAGKCGSEIAAQAYAIAELASKVLENPDGFDSLLTSLSNITTDRVRISKDGVPVRSCAEGLFVALLKYKQAKYNELEETVGDRNYKQTHFLRKYD